MGHEPVPPPLPRAGRDKTALHREASPPDGNRNERGFVKKTPPEKSRPRRTEQAPSPVYIRPKQAYQYFRMTVRTTPPISSECRGRMGG